MIVSRPVQAETPQGKIFLCMIEMGFPIDYSIASVQFTIHLQSSTESPIINQSSRDFNTWTFSLERRFLTGCRSFVKTGGDVEAEVPVRVFEVDGN